MTGVDKIVLWSMDGTSEILLTVEEVALMLKVSERTIDRLAQRGELKKLRVSGNAVRIPKKSVDSYLAKSSKPESLGNIYDELKKIQSQTQISLKNFQAEGPIIISVVNHKGGVGKSELVKEAGAYFAMRNKKVLLIDNDPQGNLSSDFEAYPIGQEGDLLPQLCHVYDKEPMSLGSVIRPTYIRNLDIVPNSVIISSKEYEIMSFMYREQHMKNYFKRAENLETINSYDYVIFDNPPSGGVFVINALMASHFYLIPVQATRKALEGTYSFSSIIRQVVEFHNIYEIGKVLTYWDSRRKESFEIEKELKDRMGGYVFKSKIRYLADISSIKTPKVTIQKDTEARADMLAFCTELEERLNELYSMK